MKVAKPILLSSALALGICSAAQAAEPPVDDTPATTAESGMVGGIDPATGKLRKLTDSEIRALSEKANAMPSARSISGTSRNAAWSAMPQNSAEATRTIRTHANGMSSAELPVSAMNSLTVERAADGSVQVLENGAPLSHGSQEVSK